MDATTAVLPTVPESTPMLVDTVDTRMDQDEKNPEIFSITNLEVGGVQTIVVTDQDNRCLKSFFTRDNKPCHSRLQLDDFPWGLADIGDNKVMVSLPDSSRIVTAAVTPELKHFSTITTSRSYHGLAVVSPTTLAACGGEYIDILNMQGEVMKSVSIPNDLIATPWYTCVTDKDHFLISDSFKDIVICLTLEGQSVWSYTGGETVRPPIHRGVRTCGGEILVAASNFKKVILLSESGQYVRDVLTAQDGLWYPQDVFVDKHGSLFVCDVGKILKFKFVRK